MAETLPEKLKRWRRERNERRKQAGRLRDRLKAVNTRIRKLNAAIRRASAAGVPPMNPGGWHPDAIENQTASPLSWVAGKPKLVWHTTEGSSLPGYSGSQPHFTLDTKTGRLWQHVPIRGGAYALRNAPGGVETNRAHAIQVELIGRAAESHTWTDGQYANIAKLARWVEKHAGVPRTCGVTFTTSSANKVSDYPNYSGHLGHQHVPENDHWDPGRLTISKVI